MFLERVSNRWWTLVVRGLFAIIFGLITVMLPAAAVMALVFVFGIYAVADGVVALTLLLRGPRVEAGWVLAIEGLVSIAAGLVALFWPGITAFALFYVIAWSAIALGVIELIGAIAYGRDLENEWAYALSGVLWVVFGVILVFWPGPGVLAVLALIASFALVRGVTLIIAGVRLRKVHTRLKTGASLR